MKGSIRGRRVGRPLALLALLSLVLSGVGSRPAQAAPARQGAGVEFTVDSIADDADADPGDGVCATSVGECTLRAAIEETNNLPDAGTINVPDGIYNLSLGRLEIEDDLAIIGAGQDATIVDGGGTDLVFAVLVGTVDISGMTIRNGSGEYPPGGGGIFNAGTLTLTNCTISDNIQDGNGIHSVGTLILTNCTVSGNVAPMGGGIYNESGTLTVIDSTISGNIAFDGGGIYNDSGGTLTLDNSTISGNRATPYSGGGIENSGTLTVANSTISGNTADLGGGGISNSGVLTITNSTINGNTSYDYSGGIHNEAGLMMLTNSTISGNTSYGFGGGICNWGTLDVTNSTISSNTVASEGSARGGGIYKWRQRYSHTQEYSCSR
jgi:CSLREA domain-containing protein